MPRSLGCFVAAFAILVGRAGGPLNAVVAAEPVVEAVPHNQDAPPGPALSPEQAVERMTVPPGFTVEVVAAEPDLVNPVAMTFDERGRVWVTESFEYPRREPGPGRDRIKILEDRDGDGRMETVKIFAEGLNIPSGIAVGHGGVWVANAPDLLFMRDLDGDDRADTSEVVVTGFGRDDTHELPNSLTWGPDGWLYGLNGVFNRSVVEQNGQTFDFTCALFRIHPRTREFQLFAEGTSNPWGIAWNEDGAAFLSACVIDHLWHLVERGYYHRQGGPYPEFTWKMGSIVDYRHQKAAYCGIHYFDSDAYPEEYRGRLYMGNIHGGCINVDSLDRNGSTYVGRKEADFLTANDAWFMPVVQKTGPDGCLYVLDWYDRYHCYQDANRDPEGIDRGKGRLYRVRYQGTPRAEPFNLAEETDEQLIERLASPNVYFRDLAQRLLAERNHPETNTKLETLVLSESAPRRQRMHAMWARIGAGPLGDEFVELLPALTHGGELFAFGLRAIGDVGVSASARAKEIVRSSVGGPGGGGESGPSAIALQAATAAPKVFADDPRTAGWLLARALVGGGDDPVIPHVVWQCVHPLLDDAQARDGFLSGLRSVNWTTSGEAAGMLPHLVDRLLSLEGDRIAAVAELVAALEVPAIGKPIGSTPAQVVARCLDALLQRVRGGEISAEEIDALKQSLAPSAGEALGRGDHPLRTPYALLATVWGDAAARDVVLGLLRDATAEEDSRLAAADVLLIGNEESTLIERLVDLVADRSAGAAELRGDLIASLGRSNHDAVADRVLASFDLLDESIQPRAIELLAGRAAWAKKLLEAVGRGDVAAGAINQNQVRRMLAAGDSDLTRLVTEVWGTIRPGRDPQREQGIDRMKLFVRTHPGDPHRGQAVFAKVCGQCHKIYGVGEEVGPDLTGNGRNSFEQLVSNVFDPSLVIGAAYQARTAITADGRVITGLLAEDSPARVVLTTQGGKAESIPRDDLDELIVSELSLMPEDLEAQTTNQELADLFAFLVLDKPPTDPSAKILADFDLVESGRTDDPAAAQALIDEVAPGFTLQGVGEGGVALLEEHRGRRRALRTHPVARNRPARFSGVFQLPADKHSTLQVVVAGHEAGDWRLVARVGNATLLDETVGDEADAWETFEASLDDYAGETVTIEVENAANGWNDEFGFWNAVQVLSD